MRKTIYFLSAFLLLLLVLTQCFRRPFIKKFGAKGLVMVYHVKHREELDAEFVIITRVYDKLIVEVIHGPGEENVITLEDGKARQYLNDAELDY